MKEKLKNTTIKKQKKFPEIHGKTTIQFFDGETGEKIYDKTETNLVTNAFVGPIIHDIGEQNSYLSPWNKQVQGIKLTSTEADESVHNTMPSIIDYNTTGLANLQVNTGTTLYRMSYNQTESGPTEYGYRYVWDAGLEQCNGQISSIQLLGYDPTSSSYSAKNSTGDPKLYLDMNSTGGTGDRASRYNVYPAYICNYVETSTNSSNKTLRTEALNIVNIDWENEQFLSITPDFDNEAKITIKKISFDREKYNPMYGVNIEDIESHDITFSSSLNYFQSSSSTYAYPWSASVQGTTLYLVRGLAYSSSGTNQLRIIKINLLNYTFTDETKTLTQSIRTITNYPHSGGSKWEQFFFYKDFMPIKDGYMYFVSTASTTYPPVYKVNLADTTDITKVFESYYNTDYSLWPSIVTDECVIMSSLKYYSSQYFRYYIPLRDIDPDKNRIICSYGSPYANRTDSNGYFSSQTDYYLDNSTHYNIIDYKDGVLTTIGFPYSGSGKYNSSIYIYQYRMGVRTLTINNVTPVEKTADKTMRIIYELEMEHNS